MKPILGYGGTHTLPDRSLRSLGFALALAAAALQAEPSAAADRSLVVTVTNPTAIARPAETLELPWTAIAAQLPAVTAARVRVTDPAAGGQDLLVQIVLDAVSGLPRTLLAQADFAPGETKAFEVTAEPSRAKPNPVGQAFGRFVPERQDDFAWENDRVAFRMYGPALAAEGSSSGIDCWLKRVPYPVIDKWYRLEQSGQSYHVDHGEGLDAYDVGKSRGAGGVAYLDGSQLVTTGVFQSWRRLANGPIRIQFELKYAPVRVDGHVLEETRLVSLDLGQQLSRHDLLVRVDGVPGARDLAIGLTTHDGRARSLAEPSHRWVATWEALGGAGLGTGAVTATPGIVKTVLESRHDRSHIYLHTRSSGAGQLTYLAGFGWQKAGRVPSPEAWTAELTRQATRLAAGPLTYAFRLNGP